MDLELNFKAASFTGRLLSWYKINEEPHPWRLKFKETGSPYYVWVSEIMLQQTVIKAVLPKYTDFFTRFPKLSDLALASEQDVRLACSGLGYYRRFSFMHRAAKEIMQSSKSSKISWPTSYKDWINLPGIGSYSAAAISSITCNEAVPVVDGNVERVMCRLFDLRMPPNLPELKKSFFNIGEKLISQKHPGDYNQAIMELGQKICRVSNPKCSECPISQFCLAKKNNSVDLAPAPKIKPNKISIKSKVFVYHDEIKDRYALISRGEGSRFLKNTDGFVSEHSIDRKKYFDCEEIYGLKNVDFEPVGVFSHTITNHKMNVEVLRLAVKSEKIPRDLFKWYDRDSLGACLISSYDKKVLRLINKHK